MEKKKIVVLMMVAVSILLVCVVSVTLAYYVVSVGGTGNTTNNQTVVKAVDLGSIYYDGVTTFTGTNLYPGQKFVQEFKIGPNSISGTGIYEIDLKSVLPSEFGSDVTIKLYKTTDKTNNNVVRTEGTLIQSNGQYYQEDTITVNGTPELVYEDTLTNSSQITLEQAYFDVSTLEETTYYLVYDYANNGNQDVQQGKTFNGKVTVRLINEMNVFTEAELNNVDPVLAEGLVPVLIEDDGTVLKADVSQSWYMYEEKKWANAIILNDESINYSSGDVIPESNIESYFVWIP